MLLAVFSYPIVSTSYEEYKEKELFSFLEELKGHFNYFFKIRINKYFWCNKSA